MAGTMDMALQTVESIHGRYASVLALKPQCRKMCTVADIVEEEISSMQQESSGALCAGLAILEDFVGRCSSRPVEMKIFQRSHIAAAKKAVVAIKDALAALKEASESGDEIDEIATSLAPRDDDVRKALLSSGDLLAALVSSGAAKTSEDAEDQVRQILEEKTSDDFPDDPDLVTALKDCYPDVAPKPAWIASSNGGRRRVSAIKATEDLKQHVEKGPVVPDQFRCPITLEIMSEPVFLFTQSGRSFEREALEHWLELHPTVDPLTNEEHGMLLEYAPNRVLKEVIALWCAENKLTLEECRSPGSCIPSSSTPAPAPTVQSSSSGAFPNARILLEPTTTRGGTRATHVDLETQASQLEARYPGVGGKVHRLSLSYDEETRGRAAAGLLKAMEESETEEGEPVARMIAEAGGVPALVVLLAASSRAARESAAMALCRVARRPRDNRAVIVNARGIAACVRLLTATDVTDLTRQAAAGVLQHVACFSMQFKVAIANAGAIPLLVGLLGDVAASDDTKADAARCLWSIAVNDQKKISIANAGAIPHLVALVARRSASSLGDGPSSNIAVREAAAGALQNLAANNSDNKAAIISAGAVPPLVELLSTSSVETARETAAGALQNLAKHREANKSVLIEAGVLPPLIKTLGDDRASARSQRTSARAIENLVWTSNDDNKRAVIDAGAVPVLCAKVIDADADPEVRQASAEALKVLATTPKLRTKVARHLGQNWSIMSPSERDVENLINSSLRRH